MSVSENMAVAKARDDTVLIARDLKRHYAVSTGSFSKPTVLKAVDGASFTLQRGRTLAVVGESGCGKSTLARLVTMIEPATAGALEIGGVDVVNATKAQLAALRSRVQIVFQNPFSSLNPRQRIGDALEEPLKVNTRLSKAERGDKARAMMAEVGLRPEFYDRYPHMFSGGQRQRIARCPRADAGPGNPGARRADLRARRVDPGAGAQSAERPAGQAQSGLTLFISHDLSVVSAHRRRGDGDVSRPSGGAGRRARRSSPSPRHPYTQALLSATPVADPTRQARAHRAVGRVALADRAAAWLHVSSALPEGRRYLQV